MLNYVSEISGKIVKIDYINLNKKPELRKQSRINSIYSSLAIENNPLSSNLHIVAPPLSDIPVNNYSYPSALELDIHFDDGNITNVTTKQLIYHNNSFVTISELQNSIKKKVKTI